MDNREKAENKISFQSVDVKADVDTNSTSTAPEIYNDHLKNRKALLTKMFAIVFIVIAVVSVTHFLIDYYKNNLSPDAILRKSYANFLTSRRLKYKGTAKVAFSYSDMDEKLDAGNFGVYSLLKSSSSSENTLEIQGEHDVQESSVNGNLLLTWNVSENKLFTVDAKYEGGKLNYKVTPYQYSGLVDESIVNSYEQIDLSDLLKKILGNEGFANFEKIKSDDIQLEKVEFFRDDVVDGVTTYHYKVKLNLRGELEKLVGTLNGRQMDLWVSKKDLQIVRSEASFEFENIGSEGNGMNIYSDIRFVN